uniref:Uncharacterized protein n=1 Tax=Rhipicephalus zambeziensis TaxID=60191 RepID=A0A224YGJ5_9ACAR
MCVCVYRGVSFRSRALLFLCTGERPRGRAPPQCVPRACVHFLLLPFCVCLGVETHSLISLLSFLFFYSFLLSPSSYLICACTVFMRLGTWRARIHATRKKKMTHV